MDEAKITRLKGQHGFHIFRHSAGSILYKRSRDLKMVQGALRHADIATTSGVYIHLDDEVLSEGTELLMTEIFGVGAPVVPQESKLVS
jgi:integrase